MSRVVNVGAAQMGPIAADESRAEVAGLARGAGETTIGQVVRGLTGAQVEES